MGSLFNQKPIEHLPAMGVVLVVDDEPTVRDCVSGAFATLGFKVVQASDGFEALEIYQTQGDFISLVFMDIAMPRMDGIRATQRIRELNPKAKVILSSGSDVDGLLREAKPDAFLPKPYLRGAFLEALHRVLDSGVSPNPSLQISIPL